MSKRMTLIIGATCSDGLYFCSDTEEGTMMGGKRSVHKLRDRSNYPVWHFVMGAAGFGPLCELAMQKIDDAARRSGSEFLTNYETIIGQQLKKLYDQYVSDSLSEAKRYDRQISLVIAVADIQAKCTNLYQTHEEILFPISEPYACTGVGQEIAHYFLDRLFQDWRGPLMTGAVPTMVEAAGLLEFIMREAKATVGGVGGNTETIMLDFEGRGSHGTFGSGWEARQPQLHDIVEHFWRRAAPAQPKVLPKPSASRKSKRGQ